jgi:single-strand DNA-binding protein
MDLNKVMIIGRLTRDPELRSTPSGANVCQIGLATNYVYTNQQTGQKVEQVEYHNISLWRGLADVAAKYLKKGQRVYIEGRLQTRQWDAPDGTKKSRTDIVGDNMIMLDGGKGSTGENNSNTGGGYNTPSGNEDMGEPISGGKAKYSSAQEDEELPTIQAGDDISVEDIPF